LGFGPTVIQRNLGNANKKRSHKIFEEFVCVLIDQTRRRCYSNDFEIKVDGNCSYIFKKQTLNLIQLIPIFEEYLR
jgi:hypothetical protein